MNETHLLSLILLIPFVTAVVVAAMNESSKTLIKTIGLVGSTLTFVVSAFLFVKFDGTNPNMQFVEKYDWISSLHTSYHLGVDGMSMLLVVLTAFLTPIALLASWESVQNKLKGYVSLMLLLEVGTLGVFMSLDMFLFYVFWEAMLIPMYFIIGIWGGQERIYAAVKFFLYTMFGSLLMLVAILWLGYYAQQVSGQFTTNLLELYKIAPSIPTDTQSWMFAAFALSFFMSGWTMETSAP